MTGEKSINIAKLLTSNDEVAVTWSLNLAPFVWLYFKTSSYITASHSFWGMLSPFPGAPGAPLEVYCEPKIIEGGVLHMI